jgi:hypothetical protein
VLAALLAQSAGLFRTPALPKADLARIDPRPPVEPEPPAGMMCAAVMTFPAQFVQVPRVSGKVSVSKQP